MKNRLAILVVLSALTLIITSGGTDVTSNAAPLGSSGAPGENTCAKSTCHTGSNVNAGSAILNVVFSQGITAYQPNEIYDIVVSLHQPGIERFGYQALALNGNNQNTGTLLVSDSMRTQIQQGYGAFEGRNYITYKYAGTAPYAPGQGQWWFKWQAPPTNEGPITFYAAAVAANNDGFDTGDTVYTSQTTIQQTATAINTISTNYAGLNIFPNPARGRVNVYYQTTAPSATTIRLTNLLSATMPVLIQRADNAGDQTLALDVSQLPAGIYFLSVTANSKTTTQKVIIE